MLSAMAILPFLDVAAKFLGQQKMPVLESVWARLFIGMIMTLPFVLKGRSLKSLKTDMPVMHGVRASLLIASTAFFFLALGYLPIADTLSIFFVQPLVVTLLSPLLLKEHVGLRRWIAVVVGFAGTLVIIRPGFQTLNPGVLLALLAGTAGALYMILTRKIAGRSDPIVTMFHTNVAGALIMTIAVPFVWVTPNPKQWMLLSRRSFAAGGSSAISRTDGPSPVSASSSPARSISPIAKECAEFQPTWRHRSRDYTAAVAARSIRNLSRYQTMKTPSALLRTSVEKAAGVR